MTEFGNGLVRNLEEPVNRTDCAAGKLAPIAAVAANLFGLRRDNEGISLFVGPIAFERRWAFVRSRTFEGMKTRLGVEVGV
jgi:hypothetical protein